MARFCIRQRLLIVGGDTSIRPARNIFDRFRAWPKTLPDLALREARFTGMGESPFSMAIIYPFSARKDSSYYAALEVASRASASPGE